MNQTRAYREYLTSARIKFAKAFMLTFLHDFFVCEYFREPKFREKRGVER